MSLCCIFHIYIPCIYLHVWVCCSLSGLITVKYVKDKKISVPFAVGTFPLLTHNVAMAVPIRN